MALATSMDLSALQFIARWRRAACCWPQTPAHVAAAAAAAAAAGQTLPRVGCNGGVL